MSYRSTLQADALKLVAKKLQSSLAVEGELPEDGLAAYADDGDDLMMALACRVVSGGRMPTPSRLRMSSSRRWTPRPPTKSCVVRLLGISRVTVRSYIQANGVRGRRNAVAASSNGRGDTDGVAAPLH